VKSPAALFCGAGRITSRTHHPGFSGKTLGASRALRANSFDMLRQEAVSIGQLAKETGLTRQTPTAREAAMAAIIANTVASAMLLRLPLAIALPEWGARGPKVYDELRKL
jgi:hypothetical protein